MTGTDQTTAPADAGGGPWPIDEVRLRPLAQSLYDAKDSTVYERTMAGAVLALLDNRATAHPPADAGGAQVTEEEDFARGLHEQCGVGCATKRFLNALATAREEGARVRAKLEERIEIAKQERDQAREEARGWEETAGRQSDVSANLLDQLETAREEGARWEKRSNSMEDVVEDLEPRLVAAEARAAGLEDLREMAWGHATSLYTLACEILTALEALNERVSDLTNGSDLPHDRSQVYAWRKNLDEHAP